MKGIFVCVLSLFLVSAAHAQDFQFVESSQIKTATLDVDLSADSPTAMAGVAVLNSLGISHRDKVLSYSFKLIALVNEETQHDLSEFGCNPGTLTINQQTWQQDSVNIVCHLPRFYGQMAELLSESFGARLLIQYIE